MVDLSKLLVADPTLELADQILVKRQHDEKRRGYLGMSSIGDSCSRKLWYGFRFARREIFDVATLKRFADGHRTEALVIERLKMVPGLSVVDVLENSEQIGVSDHEGHYSGHLDGEITGLLQAPKTPHVLEVKCVSEKKFNELKKIVSDIGEKQALKKWNTVYAAQAQEYMHYKGYSRHYMVVATPGGRDWTGIRTEYDAAHAIQLKVKAERIIKSAEPPDKISKDASWFECRFCSFSDICHEQAIPDRSCRTCLHSTPIENGAWHCSRFGKNLTMDEQINGCSAHKYIPKMVPGEVTDVDQEKGNIIYKLNNGEIWVDGETV